MTNRLRAGALLASCVTVLAGCASTQAAMVNSTTGAASVSARGATISPGLTMSPGMMMPDGSAMGPIVPAQHVATDGPSAAARMICSGEIRTDIAKVLALKTVAPPSSRWSNHVYTCTYRLPMGTFVLSVTESTSAAAAQRFAAGRRAGLSQARSTAGLTATAFSTPQGLVALVKDNDTLQVDATRLPNEFGTQHEKRTDFAYEIASDILGCWTGD